MDTQADAGTNRKYGGLIAVVSGGYSIVVATSGMEITGSDLFMLLLGVVVLAHGVLLFTPYADRLASATGSLMVVYAALMLLNQVWMATMAGQMSGMGRSMSPATAGMGWDLGMVALALIMLGSGVIMRSGSDGMA